MSTRALHWSLSWAKIIQSIPPHYISLRTILLSFHLRLGFRSLSGFLGLCIPVLPVRATCSTHLILIDLIIVMIFGEEDKLRISSLCSFLQPLTISSLFRPNILLSTLSSSALSLCVAFNVGDQVSHAYRTTGKIIVLHISILSF
jgi:hypothetical protein